MLLALRPTRGTVHVFGRDAAALSKDDLTALRRRIGVVFQDFRLLDHLTTYENVALPLRAMGREESGYRAEVVELLRWVGLGDRMNAPPPVLSGGEKQRAAIARALIVRPELLLADEPTGNVDPGPRPPPPQAVRRASPARHGGRHRHPRSPAHGPVRLRPQTRRRRRQAHHLRRVAVVNEPIVDPLLAAEPEAAFESDAPLIPRNSIAGRALVVVIAIMTFLACLTAGAALLVADASRGWRSEVLRDVTIQVKAGAWRRYRQPGRQSGLDRLAGEGRRIRSRLFES